MHDPTTRQSVLFPDLFRKPLIAQFDRAHASSDGGAILLKAADRRLGLIDGLAACLEDRREPGKVAHSLRDLLGQRIFAIACGYPDANDAARLADDPVPPARSLQGPEHFRSSNRHDPRRKRRERPAISRAPRHLDVLHRPLEHAPLGHHHQ